MELSGERLLPVDRDTAWKELNDVEALKQAVPGCESITPAGLNMYDVAVNAAVGPVKARFKGTLELADIEAPDAYTIRFDLQGGVAGFARGQARVTLVAAAPHSTLMRYEVRASIGGKLAQIGSRLVDAAAATMSDKFFATFSAQLAAKHPPPTGATPAVPIEVPGFWATLWAFLKRLFGAK